MRKTGRITDPFGCELLKQRVERAYRLAVNFAEGANDHVIETEPFDEWLGPSSRILITGIGSSEAHARYLVYLLNGCCNAGAAYCPLHLFARGEMNVKGAHVIIFSQGLSPNARIVIGRAREFESLTVFCSQEAMKLKKLPAIAYAAKRLEIVEFINEIEQSLLVRVMGPVAGYIAAYRWALARLPLIPPITPYLTEGLRNCRHRAIGDAATWRHWLSSSGHVSIVASGSVAAFCHNLAYKLMEGLFIPCPAIWDGLQVAHGPLQQLGTSKGGILLLGESNNVLYRKLGQVLADFGHRFCHLGTPLPGIFAILEYEMVFNYLLLELMRWRPKNQRKWPMYRLDRPIYKMCKL